MKRNNLYFLSYTLFIFICFVVKCFWDYPLWGVIVAAITTASCLFACADIAEVVATEYEKDVENFTPLLKSAMAKCEKFDKDFSQHKSFFESRAKENDELAGIVLEGINTIEDTRKELVKIKKGLDFKEGLSKLCKKITGPLVVLGNLSFFCTATFEPINGALVPMQDYLTVFAFGVLMLTQYWGGVVREEHIELEENYKEANKLLDEANEVLPEAFKRIKEEAKRSEKSLLGVAKDT